MEKEIINICFREVKNGEFKGAIDAVFLDSEFLENNYRVQCYAHIGQHSSGDISYFRNSTRPAKKEDYQSLLNELKDIYKEYTLKINNRFLLKR